MKNNCEKPSSWRISHPNFYRSHKNQPFEISKTGPGPNKSNIDQKIIEFQQSWIRSGLTPERRGAEWPINHAELGEEMSKSKYLFFSSFTRPDNEERIFQAQNLDSIMCLAQDWQKKKLEGILDKIKRRFINLTHLLSQNCHLSSVESEKVILESRIMLDSMKYIKQKIEDLHTSQYETVQLKEIKIKGKKHDLIENQTVTIQPIIPPPPKDYELIIDRMIKKEL